MQHRGSGRFLGGTGNSLTGGYEFTRDEDYNIALQLRFCQDPKPLIGECSRCDTGRETTTSNQNESENKDETSNNGDEAGNRRETVIRTLHSINCRRGQWSWTNRHNAVRDILFHHIKRAGGNPRREYNLGKGIPKSNDDESSEIQSVATDHEQSPNEPERVEQAQR